MQSAMIKSILTSPVSGFTRISLEMLFVPNLVSHNILQNSANLGKNAELNTEGMHSSKKLVNIIGALTGAIGTLAC